MSHQSLTQWIPRLVVCTIAATVAFLLTDPSGGNRPFAIELEMSSPVDGALQVFFDRGGGIREGDSVTTPIHYSAEPTRYRLPLEPASYRLFRIDPNDKAGTYTISAVRLVTAAGQTVAEVPLDALKAAAQASISLTPDGLRVDVPAGSNDPQLIFAPGSVIELVERDRQMQLVRIAVLVALGVLAVFFAIERATRRRDLARLCAVIEARPHRAVAATAVIATVLATYPLFFGRSLVSPNNGGAPLIYDHPPYAYGSHDVALEDARATDIGSMMWAILPYTAVEREALTNGEFPLWNRYNALGRPLWGQGQTFFLEPVHFLSLALSEPSYRADVTFFAGRLIFAAGTGFAALAAVASPGASLVVTAAAPFIGYFAFRFNHPAYFSIVYAPWILWSYFLLASRVRSHHIWRAALVMTVFSVLQLLGSTPKEGVITFAVAHLAGFLAIASTPASSRVFAARLGSALGAATLTILLTAPHWLVFLDTLRRAFTAYDVPTVVYGGWHELAALAAGIWLPNMPYPSLNGLLAVLAGVGALSAFVTRPSPAVLGSIIAAVTALAIACGVIPASTMSSLPFLGNLYHVWNVFLTASLAPIMVVAAAGVVAMQRAPIRSLLVCVAVVIAFAGMMFAGWVYETRMLPRVMAASLVLPLAFAVLQAVPRKLHEISMSVAIGAALLMACLPGGLHFETGVGALDRTLLQPRHRADLNNPSPAIRAVQHQQAGGPFRIASLGDTVYPGIQSVLRVGRHYRPGRARTSRVSRTDRCGRDLADQLGLAHPAPGARPGARRRLSRHDRGALRIRNARPVAISVAAVASGRTR